MKAPLAMIALCSVLAAVDIVWIHRALTHSGVWRVIALEHGPDEYLVKGPTFLNRLDCYREAVVLNNRQTDTAFSCVLIFQGGEW